MGSMRKGEATAARFAQMFDREQCVRLKMRGDQAANFPKRNIVNSNPTSWRKLFESWNEFPRKTRLALTVKLNA